MDSQTPTKDPKKPNDGTQSSAPDEKKTTNPDNRPSSANASNDPIPTKIPAISEGSISSEHDSRRLGTHTASNTDLSRSGTTSAGQGRSIKRPAAINVPTAGMTSTPVYTPTIKTPATGNFPTAGNFLKPTLSNRPSSSAGTASHFFKPTASSASRTNVPETPTSSGKKAGAQGDSKVPDQGTSTRVSRPNTPAGIQPSPSLPISKGATGGAIPGRPNTPTKHSGSRTPSSSATSKGHVNFPPVSRGPRPSIPGSRSSSAVSSHTTTSTSVARPKKGEAPPASDIKKKIAGTKPLFSRPQKTSSNSPPLQSSTPSSGGKLSTIPDPKISEDSHISRDDAENNAVASTLSLPASEDQIRSEKTSEQKGTQDSWLAADKGASNLNALTLRSHLAGDKPPEQTSPIIPSHGLDNVDDILAEIDASMGQKQREIINRARDPGTAGDSFRLNIMIEDLEKDKNNLVAENRKLKNDNADLQNENANLADNEQVDSDTIDELHSKNKTLTTGKESLEAEVQKVSKESDDLKLQNEKLRKEKKDLEASNKTLSKENSDLEANLKKCHDSHDQIVQNTKTAMQELEKTREDERAKQEEAQAQANAKHQLQTSALLETHVADIKQYENKLQAIASEIASFKSLPELQFTPSSDVLAANIREVFETIKKILVEKTALREHLQAREQRDGYLSSLLDAVQNVLVGSGTDDAEGMDMKLEHDQDQLLEALRLFVARIHKGEFITTQVCDQRNRKFLSDLLEKGDLLTPEDCEKRHLLEKQEEGELAKASTTEVPTNREEEEMNRPANSDEEEMGNKQKAAFFTEALELLQSITYEDGFASKHVQDQAAAMLSAITYISVNAEDGSMMLTRTRHEELQRDLVAEITALKERLVKAHSTVGLPTDQLPVRIAVEEEEKHALVNEVRDLKTKIETLEAKSKELETAASTTATSEVEENTSRGAFEKCQQTNEEYKDQIASLGTQIPELEKKLGEVAKDTAKTTSDWEGEKGELEECINANSDLNAQVKKLQAESELATSEVQEALNIAQQTIEDNKDMVDSLLTQIQDLNTTIQSLETKHSGGNSEILCSQPEDDFAKCKQSNARFKTEINDLTAEVKTLQREIADSETNYRRLETEKKELEMKLEELKRSVGGLEEVNRKLEKNDLGQIIALAKESPVFVVGGGGANTQAQGVTAQGMVVDSNTHTEEVEKLKGLYQALHEEKPKMLGEINQLNGVVQKNSTKTGQWLKFEEDCMAAIEQKDQDKARLVAELEETKQDVLRLEEGVMVLERKLEYAATEVENTYTEIQSPTLDANQRVMLDLREQIRTLEEELKLAKDQVKAALEGAIAISGNEHASSASELDARTFANLEARIHFLEETIKTAEEEQAKYLEKLLDSAKSTYDQEKRAKDALIGRLRNELSILSSGFGRKPSTSSDTGDSVDNEEFPVNVTVTLKSTRTDIEFCFVRTEDGLNAMAAERRNYGFTSEDTRFARDASDMAKLLSEAMPDGSKEKEMLMARSNFWSGITAFYADAPEQANSLLAAASGVTKDVGSAEEKHYWDWVNEGTANVCPRDKANYQGFRLGHGMMKEVGSALSSPENKQRPFAGKPTAIKKARSGIKSKKSSKVNKTSPIIEEEEPNLYDDSDDQRLILSRQNFIAQPPVRFKATQPGDSGGDPFKTSAGITEAEDNAEEKGQAKFPVRATEEKGKGSIVDSQSEEEAWTLPPGLEGRLEMLTPEDQKPGYRPTVKSPPMPVIGEEEENVDDKGAHSSIGGSIKSGGAFISKFFGAFMGGI